MVTERVSAGKKLKVHSLIDKVYHPTNLEMAWKKVKANGGAGGIDGICMEEFEKVAVEELKFLHEHLKNGTYDPLPVKRVYIPKRGKPKEKRPLGIPTIKDRVCQQALKNRTEPIFENTFNDCSFGYRPGRSPHDAMRKIWREIQRGNEWIVDGDLRDYFGTVDHEKLVDMVAEQISDGRILDLIRRMLKAGYVEKGSRYETGAGTPQGSVISPLLSNIYLTPFDNAMTGKGFKLPKSKIKMATNTLNLYAFPTEKSINRFMDTIRQRTKRKIPITLKELIDNINPVIRGWGNYYHKSHVRKLFNKLDRWIIRRLWSHQYKRWRNTGWKKYPAKRLYGEYELVNLIQLIPGLGEKTCS